METERAEAVVLRLHPVTESSLIVTWFTREFGKLKTLAKGARRPKGPFRGKIDLFYRDEILFLRSRRSDLHLLHDCFLEDPHRKLRGSVRTLAAASYATELVEIATEAEDPNAKLFELLVAVLDSLEGAVNAAVVIWFELQVLAATGWAPRWPASSGTTPEAVTGTNKILKSLATATLASARRVRLSEAQAQEAREALWRHWGAEVGKAPRSRNLLVSEIRR
jgi:DNA repair protein RecO (recombination protein O)